MPSVRQSGHDLFGSGFPIDIADIFRRAKQRLAMNDEAQQRHDFILTATERSRRAFPVDDGGFVACRTEPFGEAIDDLTMMGERQNRIRRGNERCCDGLHDQRHLGECRPLAEFGDEGEVLDTDRGELPDSLVIRGLVGTFRGTEETGDRAFRTD